MAFKTSLFISLIMYCHLCALLPVPCVASYNLCNLDQFPYFKNGDANFY